MSTNEKKVPKWLMITTGACIIVIVIIFLIPSDPSQSAPQPAGEGHALWKKESKQAFDIPKMINNKFSTIKELLGEGQQEYQATELQIQQGEVASTISYKKDGYQLSIDYFDQTDKIESMFLSLIESNGDAKLVSDPALFYEGGNLHASSSDYTVQLVPVLNDKAKYTGIKVLPNNRK